MSSKHRHEADKRVKNILTKCKKLGISGDQLAEALDIIFIPSESWKISFKVKIFIFVAILGVGTYFYNNIISYGRVRYCFNDIFKIKIILYFFLVLDRYAQLHCKGNQTT